MFNGVRGYDRPRRFDAVPPLVTSAAYLDDRFVRTLGNGWLLSAQAGLRADLLHRGSTWASGVRDLALEPRLEVELAPGSRFRVRAGAGRVAKVPDLASLFPDRQCYDLVNFNWYANEPAEQRADREQHKPVQGKLTQGSGREGQAHGARQEKQPDADRPVEAAQPEPRPQRLRREAVHPVAGRGIRQRGGGLRHAG